MQNSTLYNRVGGENRVNAVVDALYGKVLGDDGLNYFFEGVSMEAHLNKLKSFLRMAFGGGKASRSLDLSSVHASLVDRGLGDVHINSLIMYMREVLEDQGLNEDLILGVEAVLDCYRDNVLGR